MFPIRIPRALAFGGTLTACLWGLGADRFGRITVGGRRQGRLRAGREHPIRLSLEVNERIFRRTSQRLPRDAYGLRGDRSRPIAAAFSYARSSRAVAGGRSPVSIARKVAR
jgi:hypothetical protein